MTGVSESALTVLDALLVAGVVAAAALAVLVPRRAAATIAFLIFGILVAVLWGRADAPDVAIAEVALGGGIAGAILVDALGRRRPPRAEPDGRGRAATLVATLGGAVALVALLLALREVSAEPAALAAQALARVDEAGVTHPVTAVLLNYRSLDTLLEIAVLVVAAYGAGVIAGDPGRPDAVSDPVRRALAVVLVPVILVVAIWILVAGSSQPGGAFQSGALIAAAIVIARLCGIPAPTVRGMPAVAVYGGGLLAFVVFGVAGLALTGSWLGLDPAWAGPAILGIEVVLSVAIGVALAGVFVAAGAVDSGSRVRRPSEGAA